MRRLTINEFDEVGEERIHVVSPSEVASTDKRMSRVVAVVRTMNTSAVHAIAKRMASYRLQPNDRPRNQIQKRHGFQRVWDVESVAMVAGRSSNNDEYE